MKRVFNLLRWTLKNGLMNLYHRIKNRNLFELEFIEKFSPQNSSISDSHYVATYGSLCGAAASDDAIFSKFRSARVMVDVLDHVTLEQANAYRDEILKAGAWDSKFAQVLHQIDSVGKPRKYRFNKFGTISPTLMRYLKVYVDLRTLFGTLEDFRVAEIGIGFGGQSSVIHLLNKPALYTFYDIPPVLSLASKFMKTLKIEGNYEFIDGRVPRATNSDLVVSNYAFSELQPKVQEMYLQNVILNSARGYITWNSLGAEHLGGYSLASLVRNIPDSEIIAERPNTHENNAIIVWGAR